jgi:phage terminase large subunit GpA-like protein
MLPDAAVGVRFVDPATVRASLANLVQPPPDITVTESAELYRFMSNPGGGYSGPYRRQIAGYCVEVQDALTNPTYPVVVFAAPAQSGKTEIPLNWMTHSVVTDPADMLFVLDEKDQAEDFIDRRIKKWLRHCPEVTERLIEEKRHFRQFQGMSLAILWATGSKAASKPAPRVAIDERDSMPDDLDGEGDPVDLFRKRVQTFGPSGKVYVASSPKKPLTKSKGLALALKPHEAPPTTGILALYNQGTRKRLYWRCPHCRDYHTAVFDNLRWDEAAKATDRIIPVWLECPVNGCIIEPEHKSAMLELGAFEWLAEGQTIDDAGHIHGAVPPRDIDSYWLRGPQSYFTSWEELVRKYLTAVEEFDLNGSDARLKAFWQMEDATPYRPPEGEGDITLDAQALMNRAEPYPLGQVPAAARFVTCAVDTQNNRWEVEIRAWGEGLENWIVSRFAVFRTADPDAPDGERMVDPGGRGEDWDLLFEAVLERTWPVEGSPGLFIQPVCTAIDAYGAPGVTANAYDFHRRARIRGFGRKRLMLTRGSNSLSVPLITWTRPEVSTSPQKARIAGYAQVATINVSQLKDIAARRLQVEDPGPHCVHFSDALDDSYYLELCAEARVGERWEKQRARNEAWDHLVMGYAITMHLRANQICDWTRAPAWAAPMSKNSNIVTVAGDALDQPGPPGADEATPTATGNAIPSPAASSGGGVRSADPSSPPTSSAPQLPVAPRVKPRVQPLAMPGSSRISGIGE